MPDYEIKEWNEDNFDIRANKYVYEAYRAKKYAFVSDYARLYALYTYGGIYLDTDVEARKSFDGFLSHKTLLGWEADYLGTGMMACEKGQEWTKRMMDSYDKEAFITFTGKMKSTPNPYRLCETLKPYGLKMDRKLQVLKGDIYIYPIEFFCAHLADHTKYCITADTVCIHHYNGSWGGGNRGLAQKLEKRIRLIALKISICLGF